MEYDKIKKKYLKIDNQNFIILQKVVNNIFLLFPDKNIFM